MICKHCGTELNDEQMYCPKCGWEVQIVSEYNPQDDIINISFQNDDNQDTVNDRDKNRSGKAEKGLLKSKIKIIIASIVLALILICIALYFIISNKNNNSYEYQQKNAAEQLTLKNYEKAKGYALQAYNLNGESLEIKKLLLEIYYGLADYDSAVNMLVEIISTGAADTDIYEKAVNVFSSVEDYDNLAKILSYCEDKEIESKYGRFFAPIPEFSSEAGAYTKDITLEITSRDGLKILYSIDGTNPVNGKEYKKAFLLPAGNTTVRAVTINEYGVVSNEKRAEFQITPDAPDLPEISTPSGNVSKDTEIIIKEMPGCTYYYTWDGSNPTINDEEYSGGLTAPVGNNILSVIAVDRHGQTSGVSRKNYIRNEENEKVEE